MVSYTSTHEYALLLQSLLYSNVQHWLCRANYCPQYKQMFNVNLYLMLFKAMNMC